MINCMYQAMSVFNCLYEAMCMFQCLCEALFAFNCMYQAMSVVNYQHEAMFVFNCLCEDMSVFNCLYEDMSVFNCLKLCSMDIYIYTCPCSTVNGSHVCVLLCTVLPSASLPFLFCCPCFFSSLSFLLFFFFFSILRCTAMLWDLKQPTTTCFCTCQHEHYVKLPLFFCFPLFCFKLNIEYNVLNSNVLHFSLYCHKAGSLKTNHAVYGFGIFQITLN